jgi:radical SAM superfamily enzyme YgiQ (UPF0313 family)
MADILLTHSNHLFADKKQIEKMQPYPPLLLLIAAAALERAGFSVALFDPTFDASMERFQAALEIHRPQAIFVCEDDFNFITKMCLMHNRQRSFAFAAAARECGLRAFAHGSDATDHPEAYLAAGFDAVLLGDVEQTIVEPMRRPTVHTVAGVVSIESGCTRRSAPRAHQPDLDCLPAPAWHLLDVAPYREAWRRAHGVFSMNLATSRGCPYRCNWCAKPVFGSSYRVHSPQRAAEELFTVKQQFAPDRVWFADDIFGLSPRWARQFADEVDTLGARIPFKIQSRCDLMTPDTVAALQRAGCQEVWMGAESGSQVVLDAMDKDIRVEEIYAARRNLRAHGIRACFFLQFGYPGEQWSDICKTIQMVRATAPDDIGVSVSYPLPGTRFHQIVSAQMEAKANWIDSADLSMMFRGEFSTEFYRALAHALHAEVRSASGADEAWAEVHRLREARQMAVA